jgi:enoyl-CoA hydratase/carnithine racemase
MFDLMLDGGVARLTLNRPEARNAIPVAGWPALAQKVEEAGDRGARALLLAGAGAAFCAGADLSEFAAMSEHAAAVRAFREAMRDSLARLSSVPIPTVAVVEGACFGAGVALAMACDIRIASPAARFAITPAKLGISYPQEDVHRLVSLVGRGQAARLLLGAGTVGGGEAAAIGLAELCVEAPEEAATSLVHAMVANSASSLETLKRGIALAATGRSSDPEQDRRFDRLLLSEDLRARLRARRGGH